MKREPSKIDIAVGQRLRAARIAAGMTQKKLGDALDISFQQIQKYEKGTNRVSISAANLLAAALCVPLDQLTGVGVTEASNPHALAMLATPEGQQLAEAFNQIRDGHQRRSLVNIVEYMAHAALQAAVFRQQAAE